MIPNYMKFLDDNNISTIENIKNNINLRKGMMLVMKNQIKGKKGVTLVALVVTIIVLLILAGITIATLSGDNGIVQKAGEAKEGSKKSELEEEIQLLFLKADMNKKEYSEETMKEKLKEKFESAYGKGAVEIDKVGDKYKIKINGESKYKIDSEGTLIPYEEMAPGYIYGRLDGNTLYLRATDKDENNNTYIQITTSGGSYAISNKFQIASIEKVVIQEPISTPENCRFSFFNNCSRLKTIENIENLHTEHVSNMTYMFNECSSLTNIDLRELNTSNVTDMSYMFNNCRSLKSLNLSEFDTSKVKSMVCMFGGSGLVDLDLSKFNTPVLINMGAMFMNCTALKSINFGAFNTKEVTQMWSMFNNCPSLTSLDLSGFDTSKASTMSNMFLGCRSLRELNLSSFNTRTVTNFNSMFGGGVTAHIILGEGWETDRITPGNTGYSGTQWNT